MRFLLLSALLVAPLLAACTQATASRVGERTYKIEGPPIASESTGPNRRLASRICPKGYLVLDSETHKGGMDRATDGNLPVTTWRIRCI
jgi:hypothetical protein